MLFEEMDGVWLSMQDSTHKKMKKQELKVFTMYEGWDEESTRRRLVNKAMLAGMEKNSEFHWKKEWVRRDDPASYATFRCEEDGIQKGVYSSVLFIK